MNIRQFNLVILFGLVKLVYCINNGGGYYSKVCNVFHDEYLMCENGGLESLPINISNNIRNIKLIGHNFLNKRLTKANFSHYNPPKYYIRDLSIRQSNIEIIEHSAFSHLLSLDNLDLSSNNRLVIKAQAFSSLKLKVLNLNNIKELYLDERSFENLNVLTLVLTNSNLKKLDYVVIRPIYNGLNKLMLAKNLITELSPKFEKLFSSLDTLELGQNPIDCSCKMGWLNKVLRNRLLTGSESKSDRSFDHPSKTMKSKYPICKSPPHLRGYYMSNISFAEFTCKPPVLDLIDINFQNLNLVKLTCSVKYNSNKLPIRVFWDNLPSTNFPSSSATKAVMFVKRENDFGMYQCYAKSATGNSTIRVNIKWPSIKPVTNNNEVSSNTNNNNNNNNDKNSNIVIKNINNDNFFYKEQFTLLEMLGAVLGTFTLTLFLFLLIYHYCIRRTKYHEKKSALLITKASTISNSSNLPIPHPGGVMINGGGGTTQFKYHSSNSYSNNTSNTSNTNNNNNNSLHPQNNLSHLANGKSNCTIYETPVYNDSQTYDIPNNNHNHNLLNNYSQTLMLDKPSNVDLTPTHHFIDYRTQRKIQP